MELSSYTLRVGLGLTLLTTLAACNGKPDQTASTPATSGTAGAADTTRQAPAAATAPKPNLPPLNTSTWVPVDIAKIRPLLSVILSLPPKTKAKALSETPYSDVEVALDKDHLLYVSHGGAGTIKESLAGFKDYTVEHDTIAFMPGKVVQEFPDGLLYTRQMKPIAHLAQDPVEIHFVYFLAKGDDVYTVRDVRPFVGDDKHTGAYTEDKARQLFDAVKATAKVK